MARESKKHKIHFKEGKMQSKEIPAEGSQSNSIEASQPEHKPVEEKNTSQSDDSITISGKTLLIGLAVILVIALLVWRIQYTDSTSGTISEPAKQGEPAKATDEIVARVNGQEILRSAIDHQIEQLPSALRGGLDFAAVLNASINEALLLQKAKKKGIEVSTEETTAFVMITLNQSGITIEELDKKAKERGLNRQEIIEMFQRRLIINTLLQKEVFANINVSDKQVNEWYTAHKAEIAMPEVVHAKHILLAQPEEANATIERLKKGASFEQLAKDMSLDKASAVNGGDLGNFTKGDMVPEFEEAVFEANEGGIIGPVKTKFGYHIIKVVSHTKGRDRQLSEVASLIKKQIASEKSQLAANDYAISLRDKANVEWLYKG